MSENTFTPAKLSTPTPLYHPTAENAAYQLRYSWTGWPSEHFFNQQPLHLIEQTKVLWEQDRLRVLEARWTREFVQILFSATPSITPAFVAQRAKGRLDHALRKAEISAPFSRKVAVRAVGENTRRDVEAYIERQVPKERFVDPQFAQRMSELTVMDPHVDLSRPAESTHGRYWYNLHLVLVVERHDAIRSLQVLQGIRDTCFRISRKKGHAVSRLSVMPSHLHAALRPHPEMSPLEVAFTYQNNLAFLLKLGRVWSPGFYVGTFGEYSMQAVRNCANGAGS